MTLKIFIENLHQGVNVMTSKIFIENLHQGYDCQIFFTKNNGKKLMLFAISTTILAHLYPEVPIGP
jgi:hypothetical protein